MLGAGVDPQLILHPCLVGVSCEEGRLEKQSWRQKQISLWRQNAHFKLDVSDQRTKSVGGVVQVEAGGAGWQHDRPRAWYQNPPRPKLPQTQATSPIVFQTEEPVAILRPHSRCQTLLPGADRRPPPVVRRSVGVGLNLQDWVVAEFLGAKACNPFWRGHDMDG
ncbi:unnamed protein product [Protopolystoma xenopodis]|uniref:Uncharacterized protein n=1 Tax=Protopolystoma xenopodis TaxID=117903 RepID=A0A3S5AG35_9PLAT|nr:unnamed protein product [Protopolystoma xenopodis]